MSLNALIIAGVSAGVLMTATPLRMGATPVAQVEHPQAKPADDKELARKVRQAIADDHMLSPQAKTITVHAKGGKVTLSGFVADNAEKEKVESKAESIAGAGNVTSKLEVGKA
jgi:osmotically-inducible protein OsmY